MDLRLSKGTLATVIVLVAVVACAVSYAGHLNGSSMNFGCMEAKIVVSGFGAEV